VISRGQLFCRLLDASGVPPEAEQRFLEMQALKFSPYEKFGKCVFPLDKRFRLLWMWDAAWEQQQRETLPAALKNRPLVPESMLHPSMDEGASLRESIDGFELQVWREARLISSRWFPTRPTTEQLTEALRSEGVDGLEDQSGDPAWLPRPWSQKDPDWSTLFREEKTLFVSASALLLFLACLQFGFGAITGAKTLWANSRVTSLGDDLGEQLELRNRAEQQRDVNTEWLSLFTPLTQAEVIAEFTDALQGIDYQLVAWGYVDGALEVTIAGEAIDTRNVVSSLEKRELFHALRIEPGNRPMESVIRMEIPDVNQYRTRSVE
jgi:hypothetical protein